MSAQSEQKEEKKGTKRAFTEVNNIENDVDDKANEPKPKRRKLDTSKFAHLNFDPTKLKPSAKPPKIKPVQSGKENAKREMDQSVILNKPIIASNERKKRTKKRLEIESKESNEIIPNNNIKNAILNSKDLFEENSEIKCIRFLEKERMEIYSKMANDQFNKGKSKFVSIEYLSNSELFEKIIIFSDETEIFSVECADKISFEDMSVSQCVEYTFDDRQWFVGEIGIDSLEYYKQSKFEHWKNQISNPVCEAAFKRLLCIGLITNIFDRFVFKSPESEKKDWIVKDSNQRNVNIPRPVKGLRQWSVKLRKYQSVSPHLKGAPKTGNEAKEYWQSMIDGFKEKYGNEYIITLLKSFQTDKQ